MRILFVDDSRATSLPAIALLEQEGHQVRYVMNGRAAVEAYQAETPDLVLMDVVMPEMDGIEATRQIKALGGTRWVPVMMMTGLADKNEIVAGLDAGADDYLVKPIVFEVLAARMRSMQRIATMQDSLFGIVDNVFEAIITFDEHGIVQSYNRAAVRIFGYSAAEVIGSHVGKLAPPPPSGEHPADLASYLREPTSQVIGGGRQVQGRRKNNEIFAMRLAITESRRNTGSLFIGVVNDLSGEEKARRRIEYLALHDTLTTLPNRAYFNDTLDALLKTPGDGTHAVLFIDLDDFKPINDGLGHKAGDEALKVIASRLCHALAGKDFIARIGGDEFVGIIRDVADAQTGLAIASRLLEAISQPMNLGGTSFTMGASIGVAMIPQHGRSSNEILTAADNAMYAAKRAGRHRCLLANAAAAGDQGPRGGGLLA